MLRKDAGQVFGRGLAAALSAVPPREVERAPEALVTLWPNDWRIADEGEELSIPWANLFDDFRRRRYFRGRLYQSGWSAAVFSPRVRVPGNVRGASGLVIAVDPASGLSVADASRLFAPWYGLLHTDCDHRRGRTSLRVILPFRDLSSIAAHTAVARRVSRHVARSGVRAGVLMLRPSAFCFLPAAPPGEPFEVRDLHGAVLDTEGAAE